jgi:nitrate reductase cytochrome c-type subunit
MEPANTFLDKGKLQLASSSLLVRTLTPAEEHLTPLQYHCLQCHIAAGRGNNSRIVEEELNYPHLGQHFCEFVKKKTTRINEKNIKHISKQFVSKPPILAIHHKHE